MTADAEKRIFLVDSTSPFFVGKLKSTINWSKVPYARLENQGKKGIIRKKTWKDIRDRYGKYLKKIKAYGFNSVSLDELCYMLDFPFYPDAVRSNIFRYRKRLGQLITLAVENGIRVFITSDIMFSNPDLKQNVPSDFESQLRLLKVSVESFFRMYPDVSGIIFRMGEADGVDVKGFFHSKLLIRTPSQGNRLIREMLPVFEAAEKTMIFRIWSPGAYAIGDIMWNRKTLNRLIRGINSESFILSLKYGESDYFRYLRLSPNFRGLQVKFIVEFQTRREYEGFGSYPSFVGWEYRQFHRKIKDHPNFCGIQVWCQTGGWSGFRNYTFMKGSSIWNELNTWVTIRMFRYNQGIKKSTSKFLRRFILKDRKLAGEELKQKSLQFRRFLKLADFLVLRVLYIRGFAAQRRYFFRMRVPPLVHVFWDTISVSPVMRILIRSTGARCELKHKKVQKALAEMQNIAENLNLKYDGEYHKDLFTVYAYAQEALTADDPSDAAAQLSVLSPAFNAKYEGLCRISLLPLKRSVGGLFVLQFAKTALRGRSAYRLIDRILFNSLLRHFYVLLIRLNRRRLPGVVNSRAMSAEDLLS